MSARLRTPGMFDDIDLPVLPFAQVDFEPCLSMPEWMFKAHRSLAETGANTFRRHYVSPGKRFLDIVLAGLLVVFLSPMLLIVSLAVMLDSPGRPLFTQRRVGLGGKEFKIYKFRTMTVCEDGDRVKAATRGDKRVTRVGRMLRKTSLDELPQLFNVLRGEMSLVGPRPYAVLHDRSLARRIGIYRTRHAVLPGITGWAQIHGHRGEMADFDSARARLDLDLWYVENQGLVLDLEILLRTIRIVGSCRNAF